MYSDKLDRNEAFGGGTADSMAKFLWKLGNQVGRQVIDQTEGPKDTTIRYRHHHSSYLRKLPEGRERSAKFDLLLANVAIILGVSLGYLPGTSLIGLIALGMAVPAFVGAYRYAEDVKRLTPYMGLNMAISIVTPVLVAIGLFVG